MEAEATSPFNTLYVLSDDALLEETLRLAARERRSTAQLIAAISEVDARRLWAPLGCSSTSDYCKRVLRLSEHATFDRINAARLARKFPVILERLAEGSLTLANLTLVSPFLEADNAEELLAAIENKSKREVELIVAALRPQLGQPEFYQLLVFISREAWQHLHRLQDLLRPAIGDGDPSRIVERSFAVLLEQVEKRKMAKVEHPRPPNEATPGSRHIPAAVRREVAERDGDRCAFVGTLGRCTETSGLQFHHRDPFAMGGPATAANIEMRCASHNRYEAELFFGPGGAGRTRPGASSGARAKGQRAGP